MRVFLNRSCVFYISGLGKLASRVSPSDENAFVSRGDVVGTFCSFHFTYLSNAISWVPTSPVSLLRAGVPMRGAIIRGATGDVWVGVGSVLELAARARVKFFIFYFSRIGYAPYHTKKRKNRLPKIGCARGPQVRLRPSFFFFERPQSLGSLNSGPRRGVPLLSTSTELSSAALSSLAPSSGLI